MVLPEWVFPILEYLVFCPICFKSLEIHTGCTSSMSLTDKDWEKCFFKN